MKSILRYPGSKWRIAKWIIDKMPQHHSYLEPFFGSGAVLFNKPPSRIETVNDLDDDVVNLFRIIRTDADELVKLLTATPFSRTEYESTYTVVPDNELEQARLFLIRCWQGHGFRTNGHKMGWKFDIQGREAAYAMRDWYRLPNRLFDVIDRLREVQIENRPAIDVIRRFNFPNVLIYADPPYLLNTRHGKQYRHEMTDDDHVELLHTLLQHKGSVMISGYDSDLYNQLLKDWCRYELNTTAEGGLYRKEILWVKVN